MRQRVLALHRETLYEDLEHGAIGLDITGHAIGEVLEHLGLGGGIVPTHDGEAHRQAEAWRGDVQRLMAEAGALLRTHPNEDLDTAIKALMVAAGSLKEVAERYE